MKIQIIDNVVVITSSITKEMFEKLNKHVPQALSIEDEEDNEIFKIARGNKCINSNGIIFDTVSSDDKLRLSFILEGATAEKVAEEYSETLLNLVEVEENATEIYTELNSRLLSLSETIEVVNLGDEAEVREVE